MPRNLCVLSLGLLVSGCVAPSSDNESESGLNSSESYDESAHALIGAHSFEDCSSAQQGNLTADINRTRTIVRSGAYLQCLMDGGLNGVELPQWGSEDNRVYRNGPYVAAEGDPAQGESLSRRVARIANITTSRIQTTHQCVPQHACDPPGGGNGQQACSGEFSVGSQARVKWEYVKQSSPDLTGNGMVLLHELGHAYGYAHNTDGGSRLLDKCFREVEAEMRNSSQCEALQQQCRSGELAVPARYGLYSASDRCVCVPDVFPGENEADDRFGWAAATGNFDGDSYYDLAVGAPGEDSSSGAVYIFRGSAVGMRFAARIRQSNLTAMNFAEGNSTFIPKHATGDEFGFSLAAGDINHDGFDELLIGTPGEHDEAGAVMLLPGSTLGPDVAHTQYIDQAESGDSPQEGDRFGESIAVGDFNGDATMDFAIGAPYDAPGGATTRTGAVTMHLGRKGVPGISSFENGDKRWNGTSPGSLLGSSLAAGDLNGDGKAELVLGAPGHSSGNGAVYVTSRSGGGTWSIAQSLSQTASGFGSVLTIGDFISDGTYDLAIGAPNDASDKGAVFTYRGSSGGAVYAQTLRGNEEGDQFGSALNVGHVVPGPTGSSPKSDLLVGNQGEAYGDGAREGNVHAFAGVTTNLLGVPAEVDQYAFSFESPTDTLMQPEGHGRDRFGRSIVTIPNFVARALGFYKDDIAIGACSDTVDGRKAGSVFMFNQLQADRKIDQVTMTHQRAWVSFP